MQQGSMRNQYGQNYNGQTSTKKISNQSSRAVAH